MPTYNLQVIWADAGFAGADWEKAMQKKFGWRIEIVSQPPGSTGFVVQPKRWTVERSFGWLGRHRRPGKDYESEPESSRAWILWAMLDKMLRRLHPQPLKHPFRYRARPAL